MSQFERTRVQRPNNPQGLSNHYIFCIFAPNFCFESVYYKRILQSLDTLRQGAFQHNVEGVFVIVCFKCLRLPLRIFSEWPHFFEEVTLFSSLFGRAGCWTIPVCGSAAEPGMNAGLVETHATLETPIRLNLMCLMVRGSVRHKSSLPRRWALAASSSFPRKTMYSSSSLASCQYAVDLSSASGVSANVPDVEELCAATAPGPT